MATFLVAHGAWGAGYTWKKMHPLLSASGHRLVTPTYTGLGERAHLADPSNDLELHIRDMLAVMRYEDLHDIVLIGHSYGGMVATGVADRARAEIVRLIYLDAFVPRDGEALIDLVAPEAAAAMRQAVRNGDGWRVPPNPIPPDTSAEDVAWLTPRRLAQSIRCFDTPARLIGAGGADLPRTYIYCQRKTASDPFRRFAERARSESGWDCHDIDASHSPHVTAPEALAALLTRIAAQPA